MNGNLSSTRPWKLIGHLCVLLGVLWIPPSLDGWAEAQAVCSTKQVLANPDSYPKTGSSQMLTPLSNDTDSEGRPLVISAYGSVLYGTLSASADGKSLTYKPDSNPAHLLLTESFAYTATTDDGSRSSSSTITLLPQWASSCGGTSAHPPTVQYSCANSLTCQFQEFSRDPGEVKQVSWQFGDGASYPNSGSPLAFHSYSKAGTYTAAVQVLFFDGSVECASFSVSAIPTGPPVSWHVTSLDGLKASVHIDDFPSDNYSYTFYFYPDSTSVDPAHPQPPIFMSPYNACQTCADATFLYVTPATYTVDLHVKKQTCQVGGCTEIVDGTYPLDIRQAVQVKNKLPIANFVPTSADFGKTWTLDPAATIDEFPVTSPYGPNVYQWSFGDGTGTTTSRSGAPPTPDKATHAFSSYGTYNVTLQVTDYQGGVGSITRSLNYQPVGPTAVFKFDCTLGLTCLFDGTSSSYSGKILSYQWSFFDRTLPASAQNPVNVSLASPTAQYQFPHNGTYNVSLVVSDGVRPSTPARRVVNVTNAPTPAALSYFTITPCRIYDSKVGLGSGTTTNLNGYDNGYGCGIPQTAVALAATVRAVSPTGAGFLSAFPTGSSTGPTTAIVNFDPSTAPRPNNTILGLSAQGQFTILPYVVNGGNVQVRIDVNGYFAADTYPVATSRGPYGYSTVSPCRVIDSRQSPGSMGGSTLALVKVIGFCGITPDAAAANLNLTAVNPTAAGWVQEYSSFFGSPPATSELNFPAYYTFANGGVIALSQKPSDDIAILYGAAAGSKMDYVIDTTGYFSPSATLRYYPVAPCRAVDTGDPTYGYAAVTGAIEGFVIQGNCGVPKGAFAVVGNATVVGPNVAGNVTLFPSADIVPLVSTVNFNANEPAIGNTMIVPLSADSLDLSAAAIPGNASLRLVFDVVGYFAPPPHTGAAPQSEPDGAEEQIAPDDSDPLVALPTAPEPVVPEDEPPPRSSGRDEPSAHRPDERKGN